MAQGQYMAPPGAMSMQNPEIESILSLLGVVRIITLIIGVLLLIGVLITIALAAVTFGFGFIFAIPLLLFFLVTIFAYMRIGNIRDLVRAGRLQEAKSATLLWMILGFIFGAIIIGVLLLIVYIKFDPAIRGQQQMQMQMGGQQPPAWGAPPVAPYAVPAPMAAPAPPAAPICPKCGRPATWVAQYNRWYCYTDQQYL
jgi:hypothetical protein